MNGKADLSLFEEAACKNERPELFFGAGNGNGYKKLIAAGKKICADCPVALKCITHAELLEVEWGTFGGLTQEERRQLYVNYGSVTRPRGLKEFNRIFSSLKANVPNGVTSGSNQSEGFGRPA